LVPIYQTKRRHTSEARDLPEQDALSKPLYDALPHREAQFLTQTRNPQFSASPSPPLLFLYYTLFFSSSLPTLPSTWFTDLLSIILCFSLHILPLSCLSQLTILPAVEDSKQPDCRRIVLVCFYLRRCKPCLKHFTFKTFKCTVCPRNKFDMREIWDKGLSKYFDK
jgi:hypothetical protein